MICSLRPAIFRYRLGTPLAVHAGRDDAAGISRPFTAGKEAAQADMLQGVAATHNADGSRSAGFHSYHYRFVRQETVCLAAELPEALCQAAGYEWR